MGPWHGNRLLDGHSLKSSNDPAVASRPVLATPKRCKDAKESKEKFTAWSLEVTEYEHQFKVIDEAKTFVVREMMPTDIKRGFLTGPRKFDELMDKLEIIVNEMMAVDGRAPMDLGSVGTHDARTTQSDQDASNDMSYDDVCAIAWKGCRVGTATGKKGPIGDGTWYRGKGTDKWTSGEKKRWRKEREHERLQEKQS